MHETISLMRHRIVFSVAVAVALVLTAPANGQTTVTWNGSDAGNANWSVSGNWTPGTTLSGSVALVFGSGGSATTSFNDVANLTVTSGTITGLARTITGSAITLGGNWTHNVNGESNIGLNISLSANRNMVVSSGTLTLSGTVSGGYLLTKSGAGTLRLTEANSFTGNMNFAQGTLEASILTDGGVASSIGTGASLTLGGNNQNVSLRYIGANNASTNRQFSLGSTGTNTSVFTSAVENNGAGTLTFTNATFNASVSATAGRLLVLGGTNTGLNEIQGVIGNNSQPVSLSKNDSGRWVLSGMNTYTGSTSVTAGTLQIGSTGRLNSTSGITINGAGAEFRYNSATALSAPLTLTQGTLSGSGAIGTAVSVGSGAILSPGNSPGSQAFTQGLTFGQGGRYMWEVNNWAGAAGTGYDQLVISGNALNVAATSGSTFTIALVGLTAGNTTGAVPNFSGSVGTSFTLATSSAGITGFDKTKFALDASGFTGNNPLPTNAGFWLTTNAGSTSLMLHYAPSATYTLSAAASASVIRVGATSTITATVTSSTASVTNADSVAYGGLALSGLGSLSSTSGTLAAGQSGNGSAVFTGATAGTFSFTPSLTSANNVNIGTSANAGSSSGVTVSVFSGTGSWNKATGGSWGSGGSADWTSTEGVAAAPGTFAGYANTDSATFGSTVASGTATVSLNGAQVSLASLAFNNSSARYVIATGTGSGSLTLAKASGKPAIDVVGTHEIAAAILGANGLQKTGAGKLILSGSSSYSGGTDVSAGTLAVNGSIAGNVAVSAGAVLGGSGSISGVLSGAGLVGPGNSPGILTASQFDPAGGLGAAFEFTAATPDYSSPLASLNDVLRLTNSTTPFLAALSGSNTINVYFDVSSIKAGDTFEGGFFTALAASDLLNAVKNATFTYWVRDGGSYSSLTGVAGITGVDVKTTTRSATFAGGETVTGSVTQFVIIPEPDTIICAGIGIAMAGWSLWKHRRRTP